MKKILINSNTLPTLKKILTENNSILDQDFDPQVQQIFNSLEMKLLPDEYILSSEDFNEILDEFNLTEDRLVEILQSFLILREKDKYQEFEDTVKECLDEYNLTNPSFQEFLPYWKEYTQGTSEFLWAKEKDLRKVLKKLTTDPNQLSLFENMLNKNSALITEDVKSRTDRLKVHNTYNDGQALFDAATILNRNNLYPQTADLLTTLADKFRNFAIEYGKNFDWDESHFPQYTAKQPEK